MNTTRLILLFKTQHAEAESDGKKACDIYVYFSRGNIFVY